MSRASPHPRGIRPFIILHYALMYAGACAEEEALFLLEIPHSHANVMETRHCNRGNDFLPKFLL